MATSLTDKARLLIERPVLANVATVDSHGQPQLTPVWIDLDGDNLVFNTAKGRAKDRNLQENPQVAVSVVDPEDPYNVGVVLGGKHRKGCRRPHRLSRQEIPWGGQIPDAEARRGSRDLPGHP
jgi:predicted pyridoxine 5'-phosphate oxidase superfamily flavin-nucleotide-binding protein